MNRQALNRNITLYYLFKIFREPLFWGPILIMYLQQAGKMSLSDIYIMEAVCVTLFIVLEVPTGALADLLGRRTTIFFGCLIAIIEYSVFVLADRPLMIWLANIIWVFGASLVSGADTAFLYDTLAEAGQTHRYQKILGRSRCYQLILIAITAIFCGYLVKVDIHLPIFLSLPFIVLNCVFVFFFTEPKRSQNYQAKQHWNIMKLSVLFVVKNKKVKWIIAFMVLIEIVSKIWFFSYNPYFELVALPVEYYGWMFFGMGLVAAVFSFFSEKINRLIPDVAGMLLMVLLLGAPLILMSQLVVLPMAFLVLAQSMVRGYYEPFTTYFLHRHIGSHNRATIISIQSAASSLVEFFALGLFGWLLWQISLANALFMLGLATLAIGGYLLVKYQKIFRH